MSRYRGLFRSSSVSIIGNEYRYRIVSGSQDMNSWIAHHQALFTWETLARTKVLNYWCLKAVMAALGFREFKTIIEKSGLKILDLMSKSDLERPDDVLDHMGENLHKLSKKERTKIFDALIEGLEAVILYTSEAHARTFIGKRLARLGELLGLSTGEKRLAALLMTLKACDPLYDYAVIDRELFLWFNRDILAQVLGMEPAETPDLMRGRLASLDMVELDERPQLSESFYACLETGLESGAGRGLVTAERPILDPGDFFVDAGTFQLVKDLLSSDTQNPIHVLIYGPPGTGKTQFARSLASLSSSRAFEIVPDQSLKRHRANVMVGHSLARFNEGSVLIVDEADKILGGGLESGWLSFKTEDGGDNQKSWLDHLMEMPGAKCVWIVNDHDGIPQSVIRRFAFSLQFPKLGLKERRKIWRRTRDELEGFRTSRLVTDKIIEELSADFDVAPGVISQSYRAAYSSGARSRAVMVERIRMGIHAHQRLSGQPNRVVKVDSRYRLEGISTNPSAELIAQTLARWHKANLNAGPEKRQGLRMLFHGAPGTGKTEFAHYLARSLDIELVHGRISELVSPFVGQSEINLASMFREAEAKGALLLFDEVESFLYDRSKAVRIYEMSLVNELLVCLEKFSSIFVGSTNRVDLLDPSARRRFTHQVEFGLLGPAGRAELFEAFIEPLSGERLTPGQRECLEGLPSLAAGDFSKVASFMRYSPDGAPDNLAAIDLLKAEAEFRANRRQGEGEEELSGGPRGEFPGESSGGSGSSGGSSGRRLN